MTKTDHERDYYRERSALYEAECDRLRRELDKRETAGTLWLRWRLRLGAGLIERMRRWLKK